MAFRGFNEWWRPLKEQELSSYFSGGHQHIAFVSANTTTTGHGSSTATMSSMLSVSMSRSPRSHAECGKPPVRPAEQIFGSRAGARVYGYLKTLQDYFWSLRKKFPAGVAFSKQREDLHTAPEELLDLENDFRTSSAPFQRSLSVCGGFR